MLVYYDKFSDNGLIGYVIVFKALLIICVASVTKRRKMCTRF